MSLARMTSRSIRSVIYWPWVTGADADFRLAVPAEKIPVFGMRDKAKDFFLQLLHQARSW